MRRPLPGFGARSIEIDHPTPRLVCDLQQLDRPALLVLDDVHHLRDGTLIDELTQLIECGSQHLQVVMTMRARAALPFPWWRRDGRVGELRANDLRFTVDEGARHLGRFPDLALDDDHRAALVTKLGGWPAMVSLAALTLRGRTDAADFVDDHLRCDRIVVDQLIADVVEGLPPDDQRLLLSLSILDHFDGALAVALSGDDDAAARLRRLERDGLFVVAVDPLRTTFRIHRLVAELLQHELRWRGGEVLDDLHRRAAAALVQRGRSDEAAIHLVLAGEPPARLCVAPERGSDDGGAEPDGRSETDGRSEIDGRRGVAVDRAARVGAPVAPARLRPCPSLAPDALSEREVMLLDLLPTHLSYREIAAELYVSVNTVKTQLKSLYRKLGASSRAEAVRAARHRGLLI
jgi:ATP/maltotriose-dependent transcriptional regulator MalT